MHGFVSSFFPGHLWDIILWLWSSGKITSCRQVARHGWVGGIWHWKATEKLAGMTNLLFCAPLWPIRLDSLPRPFLSASFRCSRSAISAVGPAVGNSYPGSGSSNHQARNWKFHLYDICFQVEVQSGEFETVRELSPNQIPSFWRAS